MYCEICKKEISDKVYPFHILRCEKPKKAKAVKAKKVKSSK